ncbi:MAG: hypothetical protein KatS3mg100_429 [Candidatus Parcubacteria bacterium]|nr:MAG: hypothetical protein KatS3mg100_429 [Candidatus Parcubacteria bacterium]
MVVEHGSCGGTSKDLEGHWFVYSFVSCFYYEGEIFR